MSKNILVSAAAALALGLSMSVAGMPAQAQVGIEIGPGGPRIYDNSRPVVERRVERRRVIEEDVEECRTEVRRRVNRFGETVTKRVRVCE